MYGAGVAARRAQVALGILVVASLLGAGAASAGVVSSGCYSGACGVTFQGIAPDFTRSEINDVVFERPAAGQVKVTENAPGTALSGEGECTGGGVGPGAVVTCMGGPYTFNYLLLEGGNDRARVLGDGSVREINGGDGDDTLIGGDGPETVEGGPGRDRLFGGGGNDLLFAWVYNAGAGKEDPDLELDCGAGDDKASLSSADPRPTACESIGYYGGTTGGYQGAGGSGGGGPSGRTIRGTPGNDVLIGTPGPDLILCGGGKDVVGARGGNDVVRCGGGNDVIRGGDGNDRLYGQSGRDRIFGQRGNDRLYGGSGNDQLRGGPGRDRVSGGPGRDDARK